MENATVAGWKLTSALSSTKDEQIQDQPNYWVANPASLLGEADVRLVKIGSGLEVYRELLPELENAEHEVILVTCFWARSETLDALNKSLLRLSDKAVASGRKVQVSICFSSLSLLQKVFHTRSLEGKLYPPSCWVKKFGLPDARQLSGLDMTIKSIFVLPFSVMHPKFIVLDRRKVFLPSCNVSWETWFEGCVELQGPIVDRFLDFYKAFWSSELDKSAVSSTQSRQSAATKALFLPSPHHALRLLDFPGKVASPKTPLNIFTLQALQHARLSVHIQTPNLTARPILDALMSVMARGVDVTIVTSERLMILEQLVTARTTTARCVRWLLKQYKTLQRDKQRTSQNDGGEAALNTPGALNISFYSPRLDLDMQDPVQTHLKLTIIDEEIVLLGSGNMDRASWVTSQELGVAIIDKAFAKEIHEAVAQKLQGRPKRQHV